MKKGVIVKDLRGKTYTVVGYWGNDVVLAPIDNNDDQVLIYGEGELAGMIEEGRFIRS